MADSKPTEAFFENTGGEPQSSEIQADPRRSDADVEMADKAAPPPRVEMTEEDNVRIRKKTDKVILSILVWVYFLQILDKSVLGYGAIYGMTDDTGLTGAQYSLVGSIAPIAQLAWQPLSSWLIVKVPHRILMPTLVLGWGIAQACMAGAYNYGGLMAARFFLGLFEGGCLPLFSVITSQWYRRAEQPLRVAAWYSTNGMATMVAAALSYAFGLINSDVMASWQIIFLFVGLVTILTAPVVYWFLDDGVETARFLTEKEREQAVERLRANQTGTGNREFKWDHVKELLLEPKSYLWMGIALTLNVGASVQNVFGPLLLSGLGYREETTALLNIPFGALQLIIIIAASYAAQKSRIKSVVLNILILPVIAGLVLLYVLDREVASNQGPLLLGYYLLAMLFGANPLIISWIVGNTGGTTKKSVVMSLYSVAQGAGNIVGPLLFSENQAPEYLQGLRSTLGIFVALIAIVVLQVGNLFFLNKLNRKRRVRAGKKADVQDHSMEDRYVAAEVGNVDGEGHVVGAVEDLDLTDGKNDEFVYIY